MGPTSIAGRSDGRRAVTQSSAATASSLSYGTEADTSPVLGRSTPGTCLKSAEFFSTDTPRFDNAACCAAVTGAAAYTWTPMRPVLSTPSARACGLATLAFAEAAASARPALCRNRFGILDGALAATAGAAAAGWTTATIAVGTINAT